MFKQRMFTLGIVTLLVLCYWGYQTIIPRAYDLATYQKMIEQKNHPPQASTTPLSQVRKQVRKDIWFTQSPQTRLHTQIQSDGSTLTLTPINAKLVVLESLHTIQCWMQDKLVQNPSPSQQARLIEADSGFYNYSTQQFIANGVALSLFHIPGHHLPDHPLTHDQAFLRGIAQDISFTFGGKTPKFQADHFEATMVKE